MKHRIRIALVRLPILLLLLTPAAPLAAEGPWSPTVVLDPGTVLELTPAAGPQSGNTLYFGALFDEATNSLELARVQLGAGQPSATFVPIVVSNVFALGGIDQAAGSVGFSFITPTFDVKFAHCAPPCNTVAVTTIDDTFNWIDSSSDASGNDFFVAGLDDTNNSIKIHYSEDGGATFHLLSTLTPPNLYVNFEGGKRIAFTVDPKATDPAVARNCVLYETRPSAGSTVVRINCRNGANPVFDVAVDTDIPNPTSNYDRYIEALARARHVGAGNHRTGGTYSHRQTQQVRNVAIDNAGAIIGGGPVVLGAVPPGTDFYTVRHVAPTPDDDRISFRGPNGANDEFVEIYNNPPALPPMPRAGPPLGTGAHTVVDSTSIADGNGIRLYGFGTLPLPLAPLSPEGGGFVVTWREVGLFDDSFETGSLARWSASQP